MMKNNHLHRNTKYLIAASLVAFYGYLYSAELGIHGGGDWLVFREGAMGDTHRVITPFWGLFLSFIPAHFPEPLGYILWIAMGAAAILVATALLSANPNWVLFSYQYNWCIFHGQIDPFIALGIGLGFYASKEKRALLSGVAILLVLLKPQVGLLIAMLFFIWSTSRLKTAGVVVAGILLSIFAYPEWPTQFLHQTQNFLDNPVNQWTNTSIGLPVWASILIAMPVMLFPTTTRPQKMILVLAANIIISPYSTIYSQMALLVMPLPKIFYVFAFIPWLIGIFWGPFGAWKIMSAFPILIMLYVIFEQLSEQVSRRKSSPSLPPTG